MRVPPILRRLVDAARRSPFEAALHGGAVVVALVVLAWPLASARYPPITDLPFHVAQTSILRHYFDSKFHFREQFSIHPLAVPYLSSYVIGAFFMLVFSAITSAKIAAAVMLGLLPAGLAALAHAMRKSPLLGLLGLWPVWGNLTHWGFLNFVGALGLFALALAFAIHVVEAPTRANRIGLGVTLVVLFFTHIFRYPLAIAGVIGIAVVLYPATKRYKPVLLPLVPSLVLFVLWILVRPKALEGESFPLDLHKERFAEMSGLLFGSFSDRAEAASVLATERTAGFVAAISAIALYFEGRFKGLERRDWLFGAGVHGAVACCAAVFLVLYLVLPMQMGIWWYVYPREATAVVFILLALFPDLPRSIALRAPLALAISIAVLAQARVVARNYAAFDAVTKDFEAITAEIPDAPKLLYLVFDHGGSTRTNTPFIHLPAYVQADKGGWLSFHFAVFGASPIVYRSPDEPGAVVPPPIPVTRWEWRPQVFDVKRHGPFFDWFLVRSARPLDSMFAADPSIERVDRVGSWSLYRRK